jgi:hypothetical protein
MIVCVCYSAIAVLSQIWKIIWTISESGQWTIDEYVLPTRCGLGTYENLVFLFVLKSTI